MSALQLPEGKLEEQVRKGLKITYHIKNHVKLLLRIPSFISEVQLFNLPLILGSHSEDYVDHVYRCIDPDYLIPKGRPLICEYNRHNNHTYVAKCCKDKDLCNGALNLKLANPDGVVAPSPDPTSSSLGPSNVDPSVDTGGASALPLSLTVLLPSCIIAGLLLLALFILVLMCRRKDNIRIKCLCFECVHRGETGTSGLNLNGSSTTMIQGQNYNRCVRFQKKYLVLLNCYITNTKIL